MLVFGKIPHRAMATGVEDGIEVFLPDAVEPKGLVELSFCSCVLLELSVRSVRNWGSLLLGSSGGRPPFGDASVTSTPASLKA